MVCIVGDNMYYTYFILFIIYSFIGWIIELGFSYYKTRKIINRGFLIGPYCPIYGIGCILLVFLLSDYANSVLALFGLSVVVCSILEYFTSWLMEKIFNLRWWDYSNMKYNINGRICLETMVPFGIIGVIIVKYVNSYFLKIVNLINSNTLEIIVIVLACIFFIDVIISCNITFNLKSVIKNVNKDSTEEIKNAINKLIRKNLFVYNRIVNAFPNMAKRIKNKNVKKKSKK